MNEYNEIRAELEKALKGNNDILSIRTHDVGGDTAIIGCLTRDIQEYFSKDDTSEMFKSGVKVMMGLVDTLQQLNQNNSELIKANRLSSNAIDRAGIFSPKELMMLKEDINKLGLLHSKYKVANERVVEDNLVLAQRNAELSLEVDELKSIKENG